MCPEGFYINEAGDGCIPNDFECKEGYEINERKTACIPAPGTPVPFPFLFMTVCVLLVVTGSYIKEKRHTKVSSSIILLATSLEPLQYLLMASFAISLEKDFVAMLAGVAFLMHYVCNISFYCWFSKHTLKDPEFAEWYRVFPLTKFLLKLTMIFVNFKAVRYIFSGFFKLDSTLARF